MYTSIAWSGGRALQRARGPERRGLAVSLAANLALNAAWNWAFFARRSPWGGVLGTFVLDVSNAELIRRTRRSDSTAANVLLPYAGWCLFATALNVSIARRNRC
ncbi:tryptophan-rich sensory protein [Streptomyces sp. col6]|uniref:tryptophan-rich sensory protein n=1 Tax=Streptomyces sp. col6 TaxID=2478958 RepID=UPI001CD1091E|nr:TspO/MBR family protein [Streptomyces sp. col6]